MKKASFCILLCALATIVLLGHNWSKDSLSPQILAKVSSTLSQAENAGQEPDLCTKPELSAEENEQLLSSSSALQKKQDWLVLVDPKHVLPKEYQPQNLISSTNNRWPKQVKLRQEAMDQMNLMIAAAKKDGVTLVPISSYRTWQYQQGLYQRNVKRNGGKPNGYVAQAGESQHHLGTAVDFNTVNPKDENIPALVWLRKHAGEYGFSLSFPKGAEAEKESGYPYEAWHYRYITKEAVALQDRFFDGNQHKTLKFLHDCIFNAPTGKREN